MTDASTLDITIDSASSNEGERLVQAARDLREELLERAPEVETATYYSEEIHRKFEELGFYRMLIPRDQGGLEVGLDTFYRVVIELARADMSTAWCFCLSASHAQMFANWFPAEIHDEVYAGGDFRAASMYAPTVRATETEGAGSSKVP